MTLMKLKILTILLALASAGATASNPRSLTWAEDDSVRYSPPLLGNGQLGVVMSKSGTKQSKVFSATAVRRGKGTKISSIIEAISGINLSVKANGQSTPVRNRKQTLDMSTGTATTVYDIPGLEVSCSMTALRSMPFATMASLEVKATDNVTVQVTNTPRIPASLTDSRTTRRLFTAGHIDRQLQRSEGTYNDGEDAMVCSFAFVAEGWRQSSPSTVSIELRKGQTATLWALASTICTADFADPWNESERQVLYAISNGQKNLISRHRAAWDALWTSDIEIDGNPELQAQTTAALYSLYSASLPGSGRSIAPMGLTSTHYYGHIFWDADTWMLPVMAVLNPEIARDMVQYRINTLPQARKRATAHGYKGAMFAWESDDIGEESTPTFALTGPLEHHVTADVARGAWLYFCSTADTTWLRQEAWPLLKDCADFWASRAEKNPDGTYSISNVVGADEYAINVTDNAFTNAAAIRALQYAAKAAGTIGQQAPAIWSEVSTGLRFPKMPGTEIIAEYEGYAGQQIKQADVALLAFPLEFLTDAESIERNLTYYDAKTDSVGGPAMSHSAMAVNYARMGRPQRAESLVERSYKPNVRGPFLNLSEAPGNDHVNFLTGAGGLLQALMFGYAGLEIKSDSPGVTQTKSSLPASIKRIKVKTPHCTFIRERKK